MTEVAAKRHVNDVDAFRFTVYLILSNLLIQLALLFQSIPFLLIFFFLIAFNFISMAAAAAATGEKEKSVIVVAIDDSDHSFYALEWTIDHLISHSTSPFKLFIVYAKPSAASTIGLAGPGAGDVLLHVDADLKRIAARVLDKAKDICTAKSVTDVTCEAVEGDARNVLCEAVEKHHATLLVLGNHGYGAIKRAVLGSVSDYCAHHAHCSVMIVKKPKTKH